MRVVMMLCMVLAASGCASMQTDKTTLAARGQCDSQLDADSAMRVDVVRKLMDQGRMYAALAHLDDLNLHTAQAKYLRAEILRQSQRSDEAKPLYQALLSSCLQGEAYHGLGLIAGRDGDIGMAVSNLSQAAQLLPLTPRVRNDYGYALLLMGELELAQREFLTAIELDNEAKLAESNMVILFLMQGKATKAEAYAQRIKMDSQTYQALANQAKTLTKSIL